jgi:hypothetical protein
MEKARAAIEVDCHEERGATDLAVALEASGRKALAIEAILIYVWWNVRGCTVYKLEGWKL